MYFELCHIFFRGHVVSKLFQHQKVYLDKLFGQNFRQTIWYDLNSFSISIIYNFSTHKTQLPYKVGEKKGLESNKKKKKRSKKGSKIIIDTKPLICLLAIS